MTERRVYVVRHAETESDGRLNGWTDVGLSVRGREQAEALARRARDWPIDRAVGSDLKRTAQTARGIVGAVGLEMSRCSELRERHYGEWEGLSWERIEQGWPRLAKDYLERFQTTVPPGGESWSEMAQRVGGFWREIESRPWSCLLWVGHAGPNSSLLCELMGWPQRQALRFVQDHACFSCIDLLSGGPPLLRTLNHSP